MDEKCCSVCMECNDEKEFIKKCTECLRKVPLYHLILEKNKEDEWINERFKNKEDGRFVCLSMEALYEIVLFLSSRVNFLDNQLNSLFNNINFALHDIQAPVRSVRSFSDLAINTGSNNDEINEYLTKINISSKTITAMINDIREIVSLSKSQNKKNKKIDFEYVIKEAINNLSPEIVSKKAAVFIKKSEFPICITNNRLRWVRVFQNLINNGILYNKSTHPKIEIWAEEENIFIKDNGLGIPKDKWDVVFNIFTRLSDRENIAPGTGSGLFLCKTLLMMDQCEIKIYESSKDGTTFIISF